jgi:hypothetical protein
MITYSELLQYDNYKDRLNALILNDADYKSPRSIVVPFFKSHEWLTLRESIIKRDLGFDLGIFGVKIIGKVLVHHIDPIDLDDIKRHSYKLVDPENLITVSVDTHNIIHYGYPEQTIERSPGDTIFW